MDEKDVCNGVDDCGDMSDETKECGWFFLTTDLTLKKSMSK